MVQCSGVTVTGWPLPLLVPLAELVITDPLPHPFPPILSPVILSQFCFESGFRFAPRGIPVFPVYRFPSFHLLTFW